MSFCEALEQLTISTLFNINHEPGNTVPHEIVGQIAPKITTLSKRYVSRTGVLDEIDAPTATAYASYFGIINGLKIHHLLSLLPADFAPSSILDFGAGTGTASLAASMQFDSLKSAYIVEPSTGMSQVAQKLLGKSFQQYERVKSAKYLSTVKKYPLIIAANVFNELSTDARVATLQKLINYTEDNGYIIVLEPGTQEASKGLTTLRKDILALSPDTSILYPCFHHQACQLLEQHDGWCHSQIRVDRTPYLRQIDNALGFNKHEISFSALIFQKTTLKKVSSHFRIITEPQKNKAGVQAYICGEAHQGYVMLNKRDRTEENRGFEKLSMHDETVWMDAFKPAK